MNPLQPQKIESQKAKPKKGLRAFGIVVMLLLAGFSAVIALFGTCAAVVAGGAFAPFGDLHDFFFIGIALGLLAGILAFVAVCRTIIKRRGWNSQTRSVAIDSTPMQVILTANIGDARFSSVPSAAADRSGPAKHRYTIAAVCCWVLAAALTCSTQFVDGFPILFGGVIAAVVGIVCGIVSASVSQPRRTELVWITVAIVLNFATLLLLAGFLLAEAMGRIA